jgi:hypothetical protein
MTPDEFVTWRDNMLTKEVFRYLGRRRDDEVGIAIAALAKQAQDNEASTSRAVFVAGLVTGLNELLGIEHGDLAEKN